MLNPKETYDIFETVEYFEEFIMKRRKELTKLVNNKKISKKVARKQYDMMLNILEYLKVCENMAKEEDFLEDKAFSAELLYK